MVGGKYLVDANITEVILTFFLFQSEDEASLIGSHADEGPLDWEDEVLESLTSESHDHPSVLLS